MSDEAGNTPPLLRAETLAGLIEVRALATPERTMLIDEQDRSITFGEFHAAVERTARAFVSRGVRPGDVVGWQLPTRIESLVLMGALARLGVIQVPLLPIYRERELRFTLTQSKARYLCVPGVVRKVDYTAMARRVQDELGSFELLIVTPDLEPTGDRVGASELPPVPTDGDEVRWIYYTSGTTSDPKGAKHTDRVGMASGRALIEAQGFRADDRYGLAFPFTHIGGLTNLTGVLAGGYVLILMEVFDPPRAVEVFGRHGATIVGGGTAFYAAYLAEQRKHPDVAILPKLRFMSGGAAPMPPAIHFEVRDEIGGLGCAHGYALTETCATCALNDPTDTDDHLAYTVGKPIRGTKLKVVRADGTLAATGEEGEIRLAGTFLMQGYVDERLNQEAFDEEGYFRTGDLGSLDAEGYLRITGRIKDIIIRKGENVSAKEVEDILYEHPSVAEAAVIGLADAERGERVCAVVALHPGAQAPTLAGIIGWFTDKGVMPQKIPEQLEVVDALPHNAAGKVAKTELVSRFST